MTSLISKSRRRAVVTGAARGIGAAIVRALVRDGFEVAVIDIDSPVLPSAAALPDGSFHVIADVSCATSVKTAFDVIRSNWGGYDTLVNNAGVSIPALIEETTDLVWSKTISTNLTGTLNCSREALSDLDKSGLGHIINIASVSGIVGMPGYLAYNVSKAGVIALTRTLAVELSTRIRVNAVSPGYVLTDMQRTEYTEDQIEQSCRNIPSKRWAMPEEIAEIVAFVASDKATFLNGSNIIVDGGETAGGMAS